MTPHSRTSGVPSDRPFKLDDFSMVGAGALSSVLCRSLVKAGLRLDQVISRSQDAAQRIVDENDLGKASNIASWKGPESSLMLLCIPDDGLESVSKHLAAEGNWEGRTVLHTSGVHNLDVLHALARKGACTGSFHPIQTFLGDEGSRSFSGTTIGIEGHPQAIEGGKSLANALHANALEVPSEGKALYHAASVLTGNAAVALLSVAEELWSASIGLSADFASSLGPLVEQSVKNALADGPNNALTGPIARGDVGTIQAHFKAISKRLPHLLALYGSVATETVHLAMRSGRISAEQAVALLDVISDHVSGDDSSKLP